MTDLAVVRQRLRSADYLRKWVVLGGLIGAIGGFGAALFFTGLDLATHLFLGVLAGYTPASPVKVHGVPVGALTAVPPAPTRAVSNVPPGTATLLTSPRALDDPK